jgi:hypothetical protein
MTVIVDPAGKGYMFEQLDGSLIEPSRCCCEKDGALNCPVDGHRVREMQRTMDDEAKA